MSEERTEGGVELPETVRPEDTEPSDEEGRDDEKPKGRILSASPLIWVLLVGAVAWGIWATATGDREQQRARMVIIPTSDQARTVVALPCGALGRGGSSGGSAAQTPGAITAVLPRGGGERAVAVTGCRTGGSSGASAFGGGRGPTALLVLPAGADVPGEGGGGSPGSVAGVKIAQVTRVPPSSDAGIIVVPPCPLRGGGGSGVEQQPPTDALEGSGGGVLLVPCPSQQGS